MTVLIVSSTTDPASINIKNKLLDLTSWDIIDTFCNNPVYRLLKRKDIIIITIQDNKIHHEELDKEVKDVLGIKPKQAIFISRHTSRTGTPTLTTHPIGNYGDAQFGGRQRTLVNSSPHFMTQLLRLLKKNAKQAQLYHKVCFEVTHHGPYLDIPTLFLEIGSREEEWKKIEPAQVVSQSLLELLERHQYKKDLLDTTPILLGIGGGHYAPRFTDVAVEKNVAFGHMIPTYQIDVGAIDEEMFEQALNKTPNVQGIYFHKKTLKKSQVSYIKKWFYNKGIQTISSKELSNL